MTPDVSLRRFANACWWLLRALTHDEIITALVIRFFVSPAPNPGF